MPVNVKCAYCGQMTKIANCGYYHGWNIHNKPTCNCLQAAIKTDFVVNPDEGR